MEVIIVDDGSTDGTDLFLSELSSNSERLKVISVPPALYEKGKKHPLSEAILLAENDWLVLTDADCKPNSINWTSSMMAAFSEDIDVVLGISLPTSTRSLLGAIVRFDALLIAFSYGGWAKYGFPYMGTGRNLAYRKAVFDHKLPRDYSPDLVSGDDDMVVNQIATNSNTAIQFSPSSWVETLPQRAFPPF